MPVIARRSRIPNRARVPGQAVAEFVLVVPILMVLVLAIGDFARLYTSEITVEAAAREAADYGAFDARQWDNSDPSLIPDQATRTVNQMIYRACTASSTLPDYVATGDATTLCSAAGSNPQFSYQLEDSTGSPIPSPPADCGNPIKSPPCVVHVTMSYTYHTLFGVPPYPSSLAVQRDSRFAISDIAAPVPSASPSPSPSP